MTCQKCANMADGKAIFGEYEIVNTWKHGEIHRAHAFGEMALMSVIMQKIPSMLPGDGIHILLVDDGEDE